MVSRHGSLGSRRGRGQQVELADKGGDGSDGDVSNLASLFLSAFSTLRSFLGSLGVRSDVVNIQPGGRIQDEVLGN